MTTTRAEERRADVPGPTLAERPSVKVFGRRLPLPRNRLARMTAGILLVFGGLLGFLPILGFWMVPLGLFVLSIDLAPVRRWRRRTAVWWTRRRRQKKEARIRSPQA